MSPSYLVGEVTRLSLEIRNLDGVLADPGGVRLRVKGPDGQVTAHVFGEGTVLKDAVGLYHADIALVLAGAWVYRWEADAPNAGAAEGGLNVKRSRL